MPRFLAISAAALFAACASLRERPRPPEPTSESHGGFVLQATIREGFFGRFRAREADFVRVLSSATLDGQVIRSNFSAGDLIYLLDVPPGRYAPVAVFYLQKGVRHAVRLDPEASWKAALEVRPAEISFLGHFQFVNKKGPFRSKTLLREMDREREAAAAAFEGAQAVLGKTLWADAVNRQLAVLGPPRGKILDSRGRELPVQSIGRLGYVDTLGWGPPHRVTGGLEWREPRDRARVAIAFLTPGMKGFKPKEEYLRFMREEGSPEDNHVVSEVLFSSQTAYTARYTTYVYPPETLVGSAVKVYVTETLMVPQQDGLALILYRAERASFSKFYPLFKAFRRRVALVYASKRSP